MAADGTERATSARRRRSASVTTRLLVLVLVPLIGLGTVSFGTLQGQRRSAESAAAVRGAVDRFANLIALRAALLDERGLSLSIAAIRERGVINLDQAKTFTGYDLGEARATSAADVDRALAALGGDSVITASDIADARRLADTSPPSEARVTDAFAPLEVRLDDASDRLLVDVRAHLNAVGAATVADGIAAVRLEMEAVESLSELLDAFVNLFLGDGAEAEQLRRLNTSHHDITRSLQSAERLGHNDVAAAVRAFREQPRVSEYWDVIRNVGAGEFPKASNGPGDWKRVADLSIYALEHNALLFDLVEQSAEAVSRSAANLEAQAERDLVWWSVAVYSLMIATVAVSILLARSITRPLRRLHDHAAALTAGDVDIEPLPARGPKDVAVTSMAFNDLVANLKLLDAKTRALAALDLESDALAAPLPGRLGEALQGSIAAVSGSITERDELRRHILHQASHDELTGLLNRSAVIDELDQSLARARRNRRGVAVLLIDIDDFKRLNDAHSHTYGDRILRTVADRVRRLADHATAVARIGADQFVVVLEDVTDPEPVAKLARALVTAERPTPIGTTSVALSLSVGVSFSWDADDAGQMLARADLALTRAKTRAPGSFEIFDPALQEQLAAQAAVEDALARALGTGDELFLQYQPVVDLGTGAMTSVEALVRWNRPEMGVQPPDSFIPVAERSNLIVDLDRWVMGRAAQQAATWRANGLGPIDIAVNISGRHLTSEMLYTHVHALLHTTPTDPRNLIIEITETALVDDLALAASQLEAIRGLGVRIAIDDFGTGYTSIAHLQRLPIDVIKIDRSFVTRLGNPKDRALLRMITDLGHELGNTITAEGVETAEQYELLQQLGCDRAQGYLMSRPLVPTDLEAWVVDRSRLG